MSIKMLLLLAFIPYVCSLNPLSVDKPIADGFGVNIHFTHPKAGELEMIREAGFKWVRMDFFWGSIEKVKGVYNFSDYEFLLNRLQEHNMSAYYILDYNHTLYDSVSTESGRKAYAKFAATAVEHFKGKGVLWEIWNEPNGNGFWMGKSNVTEYTLMALEAMKAIRAKSPNEIVVGPATSGFDLAFQEACLSSGILQYWDAVSVHPYRQTNPETSYAEYLALRKLIARYAPKGKHIPIISGEWGYSVVWNNFNETIQGQYLQRELLTNVMHNIPVSIWYDWHNDGTNPKDAEHNFGIVKFPYQQGKTPVYEPKEAYITAKTMNTFLNGFKFVKRIATKDTTDYVLLFRNQKNELRLTVWSEIPDITGHNISIPSDKCDFDIIHHKGSPVQKTSSSAGLVVLNVNEFVHFIDVKCVSNKALENGPEANYFDVDVEINQGTTLPIRLTHIYGRPVNGTLKLTDIKGFEPISNEIKFSISGDPEITLDVKLKTKPTHNITLGLTLEIDKQSIKFGPQTYNYRSDEFLSDCTVVPDGHLDVKSEQSVSVQSGPKPIQGTAIKALKLDYHFYGQKFIDVYPKSAANQAIPGEPKSVSFWIYGDNNSIVLKQRVVDKNGQTFQLRPLANRITWLGWRYITFKMTDIESYWSGPNDGHIKYPVHFNVMLLVENDQKSERKGTIYISSPIISN